MRPSQLVADDGSDPHVFDARWAVDVYQVEGGLNLSQPMTGAGRKQERTNQRHQLSRLIGPQRQDETFAPRRPTVHRLGRPHPRRPAVSQPIRTNRPYASAIAA